MDQLLWRISLLVEAKKIDDKPHYWISRMGEVEPYVPARWRFRPLRGSGSGSTCAWATARRRPPSRWLTAKRWGWSSANSRSGRRTCRCCLRHRSRSPLTASV